MSMEELYEARNRLLDRHEAATATRAGVQPGSTTYVLVGLDSSVPTEVAKEIKATLEECMPGVEIVMLGGAIQSVHTVTTAPSA